MTDYVRLDKKDLQKAHSKGCGDVQEVLESLYPDVFKTPISLEKEKAKILEFVKEIRSLQKLFDEDEHKVLSCFTIARIFSEGCRGLDLDGIAGGGELGIKIHGKPWREYLK